MAIKIKAIEKKMTIGTHAGEYRYQMQPELYSALSQDKVIREAALRSGVSQGVMQACWDAAGEVIKAWATEGHSVALPGLGTMRFGLSAGTVSDVNEVKSGLIKTRRIVFTPNTNLKQELKDTAIQIHHRRQRNHGFHGRHRCRLFAERLVRQRQRRVVNHEPLTMNHEP